MVNRNQKNQNNLNNFLNRYFNALIAAALVLFLVLAYFLFLGPKFSATQATIQANSDQERNLYASSLKKLAGYKAMNEIYKKISPGDLQRFNSVLPDNYVPERLFGEIEEMVSQGGWLVSSLKISPVEDAPAVLAEDGVPVKSIGPTNKNLGRYNLELSVTALDYSGLKNLLKILESNLRLFDVMNVDYSPGESRARILLTTYYYKAAP